RSLYVYDFVLETIINELLHENMTSERDVLERLKKFFLAELELVNKYPDMFEFVKMVNTESIPALSEKISERNLEKVNQSYAKVFENIDQTRFKDDIEIDDSLNIIRWTLNGLSDHYRSKCKQIPLSQLDFCLTKEEVTVISSYLKNFFIKQKGMIIMDAIKFITLFWLWMPLIVSLMFLLRPSELKELKLAVIEDRGMRFMYAFASIFLGLATVLVHNIWEASWHTTITV